MNILLINPIDYTVKRKHLELDLMNKYYTSPYSISHMGLGYLSATLEREGHNVIVAEMLLQSLNMNDLEDIINKSDINFVGISSYIYNMKSTFRIINRIRKKYPDIFIAAGGYQPTLSSNMILDNLPIDCCIIGEGENTITELAGRIHNCQDWYDVDGISYKDENGNVVFTESRKLIEDLDSLPFPNRLFSKLSTKTANIITSRGCYGTCNYCSINEFYNTCSGKKVRRRSPENVVKELVMLQNKYGIKSIKLNDDNFGIASKANREWFDKFYALVKQNNVQLNYWCDIRANEVVSAPDVLQKFVEIGLDNITMGLESFVDAQLKFYNKQIKVKQNIEALNIINSLGIDYDYNLIMFDPRSTVDEIIEFVNVLKNLDFLFTNNNVLFPGYDTIIALEGTGAREYVVENELFCNNDNYYKFKYADTELCWQVRELWNQKTKVFDDYNSIHEIARDNCSEELTEAILNLFKEFYYMDLDVILDICYLVKKGYKNPELVAKIEEKYNEKLNQYKVELIKMVEEVVGVIGLDIKVSID